MPDLELVSIIIPCFNTERWIAEAIDSCLKQTYSNVEIIIIDDGSTDGSLAVIKRYGDRITWESGSNRGGNYARNRGFELSKGQFIQYLDADDYILPEKIDRQVTFMKQTGANVVYGDWRHKRHFPDGRAVLEDIQVSGIQADILESLLADWWVSPACLFFKRAIVEKTGGWDEQLKAGQDRDFFISAVMNGANVAYQPGCYSIYRRYGNVTVSTSSRARSLESHYLIVSRVEQKLRATSQLTTIYQKALAQSYFTLARKYIETEPQKYKELLNKVLSLHPTFRANSKDRTIFYNLVQNILGFRRLEQLVVFFKRLKILFSKKRITESVKLKS